jgi:hypothetical protein
VRSVYAKEGRAMGWIIWTLVLAFFVILWRLATDFRRKRE